MADDARELIRQAQASELSGDKARARELLARAAAAYEETGRAARAEQLRKHAERLADDAKPQAPVRVPSEIDPALAARGPVMASAALDAWCSFCCRPKAEAGALVQAPVDAFICASCVAEAKTLLGDAVAVAPIRARPVSRTQSRVPLANQRAAVDAVAASLRRGTARVLLLGALGAGKTSWLQTWAQAGLGHYILAKSLVTGGAPGPGTLLIDEVDQLELKEREALAGLLQGTFVIAANATAHLAQASLAPPLFPARVFTTEELLRVTNGRIAPAALEMVASVEEFEPASHEDLHALAIGLAGPEVPAAALQAIVDRANQSSRGAHELVALLRRAGFWSDLP